MTTAPEPFAGHKGAVRAIAVLPDGRRIVTGGDDATIRVWDLRSGVLLAFHDEHKDQVLAVAARRDGRVVSCSRTAKVVWDVANREATTTPHRRITHAGISSDAAIALLHADGTIGPPTGGAGWPSGHGRVSSIAVTNDQVITAGDRPLVRVRDWSGTEVDRRDGRVPGDVAVAASADGMRVAFVSRGRVSYWNRRHGRSPVQLAGCEDAVAVAMTRDGKQVIAGGLGGGIWAWSPDGSDEGPIAMCGHTSRVRSFAVTPDYRRLISGSEDGTIRVWDLMTGADDSPGRTPPAQVGLDSDQESADDLLGFAEDVEAMAALITDRATDPPLAIALLGRWGSGKSSFMRQLQDSIVRLAEQGRRNPGRSVFATAVHQVRFDAWHYNEENLWVGIVEHLFASLAEPAPPEAEQVRAERAAQREKLRYLEELADTNARPTHRLRAGLRLWSASLGPWRRRLALAASTVALLGAATGVTWWLWGSPIVTWIFSALTALASTPIVGWLVNTWRAAREQAGLRAGDLERELRETRLRLSKLDAAQRLALVIEEARSGGYAEYRGLHGRVHADLRGLSDSARKAFAEWDEDGAEGTPPLERVILYFDDLDRCSPRMVVDVLAAIHLLLALPLFVVVVAVNPRWLRRCLVQYHTELFGGNADGTDGVTPLDYLDKIFQVVFAVRPMGTEAARLVEEIVPLDDESGVVSGQAADPPVSGGAEATSPSTGNARTTPPPPDPPHRPQPDTLRFRAEELEFIQRVRPLLDTPRALKRFVNLYRLERAPIVDDELDGFIGADGRGAYQAVLVLLAVLVSAPECGRTLIEALDDRNRAGGFAALVEELASRGRPSQARDVWTRLLVLIRNGDRIHDNLPTYRERAGRIARFSFETWDMTEPR